MNKKVGKLIKKIRNKRGLSQKELAELIKVSPSTVANWESFTSIPDKDMIPKLAKALNIKEITLTKSMLSYDKKCKKVLTICIIVILLLMLPFIVGLFSQDFANYFWLNILRPYFDAMFRFNQHVHVVETIRIGIVIIAIIALIAEEIYFRSKADFDKKYKLYNNLEGTFMVLIIFVVAPLIIGFYCFNNGKLNYMYDNKNVNKEYSPNDLLILNDYLKEKVLYLSSIVERKDGDVIIDNIEEHAIKDLNNISNKYTFLKGTYPTKYNDLNEEESINGYVTEGVTYMADYVVNVNYGQSSALLLNTIEHELCHTKGISRESEATYCSIVSQVSSDSIESNYSGYLEAFLRTNTALEYVDSDKSIKDADEVLSLCMYKGYNEICENSYREVNEYIEDSDQFKIITYSLKRYIDRKDMLLSVISKAKEMPGFKLLLNGKTEIDISEVESLIKNDNDDWLTIYIDNNKDIFNKIQPSLKENVNNFYSLHQFDSKEKEPDWNYDAEYFLKPFSNSNDLSLVLSGEYTDNFNYERVVRLLLEYFDK